MADSVFLAAQEISVGEADGQVLVTFKRAGDVSTPVTITYGVTSDTAANGADFTAPAFGTVTIPIGADRASVAIPIINDVLGEATEAFVVSIVGVDADFLTHGIILAPRTSRVSILDDENPVTPPSDPPLVSNFNVVLQPVSTGYELPIKIEFLPTAANKALVAQKDGLIEVVDMTTGAHLSTFLDLRSQVNAVQDRGLIDMAISPNLQQNPYFYATFAVDPAGTIGNGLNGVDGSGNRFVHLVRYTLDAATNYTTIVANSAVTLVGNAGQTFADISGAGLKDFTDPTNSTLISSEKYIAAGQTASTVVDGFKQNYWKVDSLSHIGGSIAFGPDGKLYVSTGDGTSFDYADPRTPDVLNINSLSGKVLRLDPVTGQGLADNPFYTAGMSLDTNAAKVFQLGLRNPFAMGFSADGQLFISNTGWNSYEMIENGPAGANFGWPYFEGGDGGVRIQTPVYKDFASAPAFYAQLAAGDISVTPAYRAFAHDSALPGYQVQAITAGDAIYSGDKYPVELTNDFFFADVVDGELYSVDAYNRQELQFLYKGADVGVTDFKQGPDGYVYYVDLAHGIVGKLLITPKATGNLPAMTASGSTAAVQGSAGEYTLTNALNQLGGVMSNARIDLSQNFAISFAMNFGANDFGADGLGFVLHNDPRGAATIGWAGANLGLMSIANGLGIAFDTYQNADRGDIVNDSASFVDTDALTQTARVDLGNIEDGANKTIVVSWNAAAHTLSYTLNGTAIGTITDANFAQTYFGGSNFVYFGFTGATGGAFNTQSVRIDSVAATFEGALANHAPVAVNDVVAATVSTPLVIAPAALLANDTDADNNPLTLTTASNATNGAVVLANGQITFTPTSGFTGAASFQYTVSDGVANAVGAVTVNVQPPSTLPVLTISGSATKPAVDQYILTNTIDQIGGAMSAVRLDIRQNFTIGFDLNFGANNGSGGDGMGFVLHNDPRAAATIGWAGANLGLMSIANGLGIAFDTYQNADRGDIVNDSGSFVDTDALTQTARIDLGNVEDGLAKHIVVTWSAATQTLSYTLNGAAIGTVTNATFAQTYFGGSNFVYFGFTGATGGAFNTQSVKLTDLVGTIEGASTGAAPVAVADAFAANEDTALPVAAARNVLTNDTDADTPNVNLTAILDTTTAHGALTLNANGTFAYTPVANYNGADTFTYHTSDGANVSAPVIVTIAVAPVNDAPTVVGETLAATRNTALVVTAASLLVNDSDVDGDTLTVASVSAPVNGTVSLNAGQVTFTPAANFVGAASFVYAVTDGKGASTNGTATVNVAAPASQAPVAVNDAYTLNEDQSLAAATSRNVLTNDTDADTPRANLTAVLGATTANGVLALAANGTFSYKPTANYFGTDTFTYRVSDGVNLSALATVTFTVAPVNDAPVITYNGGAGETLTVLENMQHVLAQITVTDADGTAPVYSLTGADAADFTIGANGALRFVTPPNFEAPADSDLNNQYTVTVKATDTAGVADTINLTINVQDVAEGAVLLGTAGNDTNFRGTANSDIMQAGAGNDTVLGLGGNDVFLATVGDGNDSYTGAAGIDTIDFSAITAAATINLNTGVASSAQTGADTLATIENAIGGAGADTITGNAAANRLSGGAGADVLTGGGGSDLFVFGPGFGADRITDFGDVSGNQDMVSFAGFQFTDIAAVLTHATQVGADTVINFGGGDVLTLANYQLSGFGPEDFFI